jgi:putative tryptophan/tyrosine transport system substrate-binding protein
MRRREVITLLGGIAAMWPLKARAQSADRDRRIGLLISYAEDDREGQARISAFLDTLGKLGWKDGRNIRVDYLRTGGAPDRTNSLAADLVRSAPDVIMAQANPIVVELLKLTSTIPIVFAQVSDPVDSGFAAGLARPGKNITGFQNFEPAIGGKWLGVLKEAAPGMTRAAVLFSSDTAANVQMLRAAEAVAPSLGISVTAIDVRSTADLEAALTAFAGQPGGGLIVAPHPITTASRGPIILMAARYRLPAIYPFRYYVTEGGMMSYGPDQVEQWRGAATYVDRILRGERPCELPIQAPTKYDLVVNLKTAKVIGLKIPAAFTLRADEVIE